MIAPLLPAPHHCVSDSGNAKGNKTKDILPYEDIVSKLRLIYPIRAADHVFVSRKEKVRD